MIGKITKQMAATGALALLLAAGTVSAQKLSKAPMPPERPLAPQYIAPDQPDADRVRNEFNDVLRRYPPTLRTVFRVDPTLLSQQQYLAPYPALAAYLNAHPEIALNPAYFLGGLANQNGNFNGRFDEPPNRAYEAWRQVEQALEIFVGFGMAIGLLTWLIRTALDYRRWNRLSKVQAEVHTRLLDRFNNNEELMAYIATPAGSKFLQSAPISLDTGSRSMGAPVSRILWSLQAGLVLSAAGCGFMIASSRMSEDTYLPLEIMGIIAVALGVGFAVSAAVSWLLSHKMGLLDQNAQRRSADAPEAQ